MRARCAMALLLLGSCGNLLGIEELSGPSSSGDDVPPDDTAPPLADCSVQRVVHLVGGTAGLAWFTLEWPLPEVIASFAPTFAYDDPSLAKLVLGNPHALFARKIGARAIWEGIGTNSQPTAFVAGNNETHTNSPASIVNVVSSGLIAAGASLQSSLEPEIPVLAFLRVDSYGNAVGAPSPVVVPNTEGAIGVFPRIPAAQLRPTPTQLARYGITGATQTGMVNLATQLAFTANAFKLGLIATVIMPAFNDDPHGAFDSGLATQRANELALALDAFYADLAQASETTCGNNGSALSLADNTVLIVTGDTPKNSFDRVGWPDGTPGSLNLMYVRGNGFTKPGWFGSASVMAGMALRTNFNPNTGADDPTVATVTSTNAAYAATLFAIARGNRTAVGQFTSAPFDGVVGSGQ
ncbi:MAG: hypothetical protein ABI867_01985 [Kofleriaceae bacterium]